MNLRFITIIATAAMLFAMPTWAEETTPVDTAQDTEILVQKALYDGGFYSLDDLKEDTDTRTQAAVTRFQESWEMEPDGAIDQELIDKMTAVGLLKEESLSYEPYTFVKATYKKGTRHQDVIALQRALVQDGFLTVVDGYTNYFGDDTLEAVRLFQEQNDLVVDGIVGQKTIQVLEAKNLTLMAKDIPVSRGTARRTAQGTVGEYLNWWSEVKGKLVDRGTVIDIKDLGTGLEYQVMMTYGANHADVEALTLKDANVILDILGGAYSWERRPVLATVNGRTIAASMSAMPHAGRDEKPAEAWVSGRSVGFGTGYNLDKIKNNGQDGVMDLHFAGSTRHMDGRQDSKHQAAVRSAAGLE